MKSFSEFKTGWGAFVLRHIVLSAVCFGVIPAWAESLNLAKAFRIQGDYLSTATEVRVDGKPVEFKIVSDHEITIPSPAASSKPIQVSVLTPAGVVEFTYAAPEPQEKPLPPLQVVGVNPVTGSSTGGLEVVIKGAGFRRKGLAVTFGGQPAKLLNVNNDGVLSVTAPAHSAGAVDIEVIAPNTPATVLKQSFTYVDSPSIKAVSPAVGPVTGGTKITLEGDHFAENGGVRVMLGRVEAADVKVTSGHSLEAVVPAGMEGVIDITVINPDGQMGELKAAFSYIPVPTIRSVEPGQ